MIDTVAECRPYRMRTSVQVGRRGALVIELSGKIKTDDAVFARDYRRPAGPALGSGRRVAARS